MRVMSVLVKCNYDVHILICHHVSIYDVYLFKKFPKEFLFFYSSLAMALSSSDRFEVIRLKLGWLLNKQTVNTTHTVPCFHLAPCQALHFGCPDHGLC